MKTRFILIISLLFLIVVETKAQEEKSFLTLTTGIYTIDIADFQSTNLGIGYEYRPFYFLGFELSGFYGTFSHDYYRLDGFMDEIQNSYMLYNGNYSGTRLSNRGYLYFNDKRKIAFFAAYYLGGYFMNADAEGMYKEKELGGNYSSGFQFFHGIEVGVQLFVTPKLQVSVSIGENSMGFTEALEKTEYNNNPETRIPNTSLTPKLFQFELKLSL